VVGYEVRVHVERADTAEQSGPAQAFFSFSHPPKTDKGIRIALDMDTVKRHRALLPRAGVCHVEEACGPTGVSHSAFAHHRDILPGGGGPWEGGGALKGARSPQEHINARLEKVSPEAKERKKQTSMPSRGQSKANIKRASNEKASREDERGRERVPTQ
jgi:hypothetical protein